MVSLLNFNTLSETPYPRFPKGFLFGTANADHQVEAYDPEREDVWDLWERCQGLTPRGEATDFANRYEEDTAPKTSPFIRVLNISGKPVRSLGKNQRHI